MAVINTQSATLESRGYKQTAAGRIPADWQEFTIGELIRFEGGSQPDKSHFRPVSQPGYVRMIQIRDYKSDRFEVYVPQALARRFCAEADIMIGRYGPPVFQILRGLAGAYNVALIKAIPLEDIEPAYAFYFLKNEQLFSFIDKLSRRSSGQTGVDLAELRAYPLPLPPQREEQVAIATALADADALIDSLEQLLTKKRQIKQGAMQELLTGKRRLPGFGEEWSSDVLRNLVETPITDGPHMTPVFVDSGVPFLSVNNLIDNQIDFTDLRYITREDDQLFARKCKPQRGDVLLGKAASVGKVAIVEDDLDFNIWSPIALIRPGVQVASKFLFYQLQSQGVLKQINVLTNASSQGNLGMGDIERLQIQFPCTEEQLGIANVLSDMDCEISSIEARLSKARALKQAMAQALLTGRIRLVEPTA